MKEEFPDFGRPRGMLVVLCGGLALLLFLFALPLLANESPPRTEKLQDTMRVVQLPETPEVRATRIASAFVGPVPTLAIVTIEGRHEEVSRRFGTGFVIVDDVIATAAHIMPDDFDYDIGRVYVHCNGERFDATLLSIDRGQDVMLLGASCGRARTTLLTDTPQSTDSLMFGAFDMRIEGTAPSRYIASASIAHHVARYRPEIPFPGPRESYQPNAWRVIEEMQKRRIPALLPLACPMQQGNSGGPVYRARDGAVVGMNIMFDYDGVPHTFTVPGTTLRAALRAANL